MSFSFFFVILQNFLLYPEKYRYSVVETLDSVISLQ